MQGDTTGGKRMILFLSFWNQGLGREAGGEPPAKTRRFGSGWSWPPDLQSSTGSRSPFRPVIGERRTGRLSEGVWFHPEWQQIRDRDPGDRKIGNWPARSTKR